MRAIFLLFPAVLFFFTTSAQDDNTINITEEYKISVSPDLLLIDYKVLSRDKKEAEALSKLNSNLEAKLHELIRAGFSKNDLKLNAFVIEEKGDFWEGKVKRYGFEASQVIKIKIPVTRKEMIGKLIESMSTNPQIIVRIDVNSGFSEELETRIKEDMVVKAVQKGNRKAELIAGALNVKLGTLKTATYGSLIFDRSSRQGEGYLHSEGAFKVADENTWNMYSVADVEISENIHLVWDIQKE
jgi:uncharacterized protein YggE